MSYISKDFGISSTFNVEGLIEYKNSDFNPGNPLLDEPFDMRSPLPPLLNILPHLTDKLDKIQDVDYSRWWNSMIFDPLERKVIY